MKRTRCATAVVLMAALGGLIGFGSKEPSTQRRRAERSHRTPFTRCSMPCAKAICRNTSEPTPDTMEASLRRAAAEIGEDASLEVSCKRRTRPVKGIAIQEPERLSEREVKARVEYVFADRNEVQIVYLEKAGERWKIARVENAQRIETLVPYGTPVN